MKHVRSPAGSTKSDVPAAFPFQCFWTKMNNLVDGFNRRIDYLRISVTDRCNFRCVYCMPDSGAEVCASSALLTFEELARLAKIAASLGVTKVRITGGEPLTRKGLVAFVSELGQIGFDDL